jgi:hypothetical protein
MVAIRNTGVRVSIAACYTSVVDHSFTFLAIFTVVTTTEHITTIVRVAKYITANSASSIITFSVEVEEKVNSAPNRSIVIVGDLIIIVVVVTFDSFVAFVVKEEVKVLLIS